MLHGAIDGLAGEATHLVHAIAHKVAVLHNNAQTMHKLHKPL